MKLTDMKLKPIPIEVMGATYHMKPITMSELEYIQKELKKLDEDPSDLSPLMVLFTHVLVDEEGEQYDEIKEGATFDDLRKVMPIQFIIEVTNAVTAQLNGTAQGN